MNVTCRALWWSVFATAVFFCAAWPAASSYASTNRAVRAGQLKQSVATDVNYEPYKDGISFLHNVKNHAEKLDRYAFECEIYTFQDSNVRLDAGQFLFKKPGMIKVKVTQGRRRGSAVVRRKDGKIKGHKGGLFSFFSIYLSSDSRRLYTTNGYNLMKADLLSLCELLEKDVSDGASARVSENEVIIEKSHKKAFVLEIGLKNAEGWNIKRRIWFSSERKFPLQWTDYKNGEALFVTRWSNFRVIGDLSANDFKLYKKFPVKF